MRKVLDMGLHMCIYPEGTRNKTNQPLKEFKDGAFRLAIEAKKAVVPAVLFNTKKVLPQNKTFFFWPSRIEMHFLDPVETKDLQMDDVKKLKEQVFGLMWNYIEQKKPV